MQPNETSASAGAPAGLRHEHLTAAVTIALAAACLLCGYEFVRSTSNTLFKAAYGAQRLPWVMAATPPVLIAVLYVYGRLLSWLGPRRTLLVTTLASAASIAACYAAISAGWKPATAVLYVLREAYVVLLIEQYWSFLNSTLGERAARVLNGPICGVGSLGAIAGGLLTGHFSTQLGAAAMLLFGAAACVPAALCSDLAYARCGEPAPVAKEPLRRSDHLGVTLFGAHPRLALLLVVILATQVLSGVLDLGFQGLLQDAIPDADKQTAFSGYYYAGLNGAAAVCQFLIAPLLLRFASLRLVHAAIPLVHVAACAWLLVEPSLASAGTAYLLFKVLDYSVFRAAKEILYIPFSFDVRYRAKEIIDVFGYRTGKGGVSLLITVAQSAGAVFTAPLYALAGMAAAGAWLVSILPLVARRESPLPLREGAGGGPANPKP
jgi:AAA family ATP:ADP antiporter